MINLLPDDIKRDMSAARSNVILFRYNLLTIAAAGGLLVICALFFVILNNNQSSAVSRSSENEAKAATYEPVQKAAEEYKANLATAKAILDKSVSYTTTIFEIVKLLPSGVVLDGISLNASDFGKQMTFTANAKSVEKATELKQNFQGSKIFTNVHFQSVNSSSSTSSSPNSSYPIQVVLNVQLNKVTTP
jgi:Tfp pilus assembly protein PilN